MTLTPGDIQYQTIDDFTAGIHSAPGFGFAGGLQAPPGSAQSSDTYKCVPGANGKGLAPGPGHYTTASMTVATLAEASTISSTGFYITAFQTLLVQTSLTFFAFAVNYRVTAGPTRRQKIINEQGTPGGFLVTTVSGVNNVMGVGMTPVRMNPTTPYITPGVPVMAYCIMGDQTASTRELGVFPNPTAPGNNKLTFAVGTLNQDVPGNIIGHQGRLICLFDTVNTINAGGVSGLNIQGEEINFTDPVNSNTFPATLQMQIFWPENQTGYGAWGSLTASSLLLIKKGHGAVLVEGDIAAPRITNLPGVQGTGNIVTDAAVTSLGVAYIADRNGLWVWDGGATSKKISTQLQDYFYREGSIAATIDISGTDNGSVIPGLFGGPTVQTFQWHDYIFVSGNWMYHIPTGGWWRLDDISTANGARDHMFYRNGSLAWQLYASLVKTAAVTGTPVIANVYSSINPASAWNWHGHPIKVTETSDVELQEIILTAQRDTSGTGTCTMTLTVYNQDGTTQSVTPWTISNSARPDTKRFPVSGTGSHIEFAIAAANSTSGSPAPMLHSAVIGYRPLNESPTG